MKGLRASYLSHSFCSLRLRGDRSPPCLVLICLPACLTSIGAAQNSSSSTVSSARSHSAQRHSTRARCSAPCGLGPSYWPLGPTAASTPLPAGRLACDHDAGRHSSQGQWRRQEGHHVLAGYYKSLGLAG